MNYTIKLNVDFDEEDGTPITQEEMRGLIQEIFECVNVSTSGVEILGVSS